jgi:preprotein translocase subunit SecA
MYKQLSSGVKISITRSITTAFENYLASIEWNEEKFSMEAFMFKWQEYFKSNAAWIEKVPQEVLLSEQFHQEVAERIDEVIDKVLTEPATEAQIASIDALQKQLKTKYTYSCKAEANYVEQLLKEKCVQTV